MKIISRTEAIVQGKSKYYTGLPCCRGHFSLRYVHNGQCIECLKFYSAAHRLKRRTGMTVIQVPVIHAEDIAALQEYANALAQARRIE